MHECNVDVISHKSVSFSYFLKRLYNNSGVFSFYKNIFSCVIRRKFTVFSLFFSPILFVNYISDEDYFVLDSCL